MATIRPTSCMHMHMHFLLVLTIICVSNAPSPALSQQVCHPEDEKALLQIKQELGNPPKLSTWDPTTSDCCSDNWNDVVCTTSKPYRVRYIFLSDLDLPNPVNFPPSVGNLPYLDTLIFYNIPNLTGHVPQSITNLTKLDTFWIYSTNVSGPVPNFLAQIKTLSTLIFAINNFTGPLPPSLPKLPNIGLIQLNNNKLTGPIPESYGSFNRNLTAVELSHNRLSGKIPASLRKLDVLYLDLSANELEGDASMLFGAEKRAQKINLSRNKFEFDFEKLKLGKNISNLDLKYNRIYGRLPEGLMKLEQLVRLNVSHNNLCGEIPQGGTGRLQSSFSVYCFAHNKCLCGSPLPNCNS